MLRSMYSGISGMKNFQTKLDVIGNNIANVSTFGFKKGRVTFKDTMNQMVSGASAATANRGGKNATQVGLGSTLATIDTIHTGSSLQTTGRALDLGIDGDGYFVVNNGGANVYTRTGNFYLDNYGTLVNADGLKVQAFKNDGTMGDVAINVNAVQPATVTSEISFTGNLSSGTIAENKDNIYTQQVKIIDPNGKPLTMNVNFYKTAEDEWDVYINQDPTDPDASPVANLDFTNDLPTDEPIDFEYNSDGDTMPISLNFGGLKQTAETTTALVAPNGNEQGKLESYNIGSLGEINGVYSNGQIVKLGQLALAKFSNTAGLVKTANNTFQESINSGTPDIGLAGDGRGVLSSGSLEMSNVDLSEEFTDMITAQRGFQANTKIITTSDEILQELVNLKR